MKIMLGKIVFILVIAVGAGALAVWLHMNAVEAALVGGSIGLLGGFGTMTFDLLRSRKG